MRPDGIVESLNVGKDGGHRLRPGLEMVQINQLAFQTTEEIFGHGIVIWVALSRHTGLNGKTAENALVGGRSILHAAIAVKNQAGFGMLTLDSHSQSPNGKIGVDPVGESIADYLFGAEIFYDGRVEPALIRRDVSDVSYPHPVGQILLEVSAQQIWSDRISMSGIGGAAISPFPFRMQSGALHQAMDAASRAAELRMQQVVQTVQTQRRVFFMTYHQRSQQLLICSSAHADCSGFTGIISAPGYLQGTA